RFTGMLQGQRDLTTVGSVLLSELVPLVRGHQGVIYQMVSDEGSAYLKLLGKYADHPERGYPAAIGVGDGFIGQCALEKRRILITDIPANSVRVGPALVEALPRNIVVLPIIFEDHLKAVIAVASLHDFDQAHLSF